MFDYNTKQKPLTLKEYGRNVQKLVDYIKSIDDKDKRTQYAYTLVDLMQQLNTTGNNNKDQDTIQKYWDDLYIMAGFDIDIDSPYPMPEKSALGKKPERMGYHNDEVKFKHYGRNIELLLGKALEKEDQEEREAAIMYIGRLMKTFYNTWNRENINEEAIAENIAELSKGQVKVDIEKVKQNNLFDTLYRDNNPQRSSRQQQNKGGSRRGGGKNNGGSNRRRKHN